MQTWACLLPIALSQARTSFQPSGLFANVLPCFLWPLAQQTSKVSLDTSIPSMESLIFATIIVDEYGKARRRTPFYAGSTAYPAPATRPPSPPTLYDPP